MARRRVGKGKARARAAASKAALQPPLLEYIAKRADPQLESRLLSLPWELRSQILSFVFGGAIRVVFANEHAGLGLLSHKPKESPFEKTAEQQKRVKLWSTWDWRPVYSDQWRCADQTAPSGEDGAWERVPTVSKHPVMGALLACRLMHLDAIAHLRSLAFFFNGEFIAAKFFSEELAPAIPKHILRHVHVENRWSVHMAYIYGRGERYVERNLAYDTWAMRALRTHWNALKWESLWPSLARHASSLDDIRICFHHENTPKHEWAYVNERKVFAPVTCRPSGSAKSSSLTLKWSEELLSKMTVCLPPLRDDLRCPERHFVKEVPVPFKRVVRCGKTSQTSWRVLDAPRPRQHHSPNYADFGDSSGQQHGSDDENPPAEPDGTTTDSNSLSNSDFEDSSSESESGEVRRALPPRLPDDSNAGGSRLRSEEFEFTAGEKCLDWDSDPSEDMYDFEFDQYGNTTDWDVSKLRMRRRQRRLPTLD